MTDRSLHISGSPCQQQRCSEPEMCHPLSVTVLVVIIWKQKYGIRFSYLLEKKWPGTTLCTVYYDLSRFLSWHFWLSDSQTLQSLTHFFLNWVQKSELRLLSCLKSPFWFKTKNFDKCLTFDSDIQIKKTEFYLSSIFLYKQITDFHFDK